MASRILGMGDVLTLIEKAEAEIDEEKARQIQDHNVVPVLLGVFYSGFRDIGRLMVVTHGRMR